MSKRPFRRPESYLAEQITRRMVLEFLQERGFIIEKNLRVQQGQTIVARSDDGLPIVMRVKLCWRRESDGRDADRYVSYSAAQLMARVKNDDWVGSIEAKMERERGRKVTHLLFVQRDGTTIPFAGLVPLAAVVPIWTEQRDISTRLIREGQLGRRTKNHAMNGSSPTIWLQDDNGGQEVADALWNYPGVRNLAELPLIATPGLLPEEIVDPTVYIEGTHHRISVNAYERDRNARWKCIEHYGAECFICGFSFGVAYGRAAEGIIHVHHVTPLSTVTGPYIVDPIADLRPVCPNCHAVIHLNGGCFSTDEVQRMLESSQHRSDI
jgi:5-methylcytosine-specific restriction protein A